MRRREVIAAMGCWATFTVARIAQAQDGGPMPVIALLRGGRKDREFHRADSLTSVLPAALKAMGWEEGRNVRFVHLGGGPQRAPVDVSTRTRRRTPRRTRDHRRPSHF